MKPFRAAGRDKVASCPECKRISREIVETLAQMWQGAYSDEDPKAAPKKVMRRRARVLEAKRQHELRTGHFVPQ